MKNYKNFIIIKFLFYKNIIFYLKKKTNRQGDATQLN
jgi:hypothetical protein